MQICFLPRDFDPENINKIIEECVRRLISSELAEGFCSFTENLNELIDSIMRADSICIIHTGTNAAREALHKSLVPFKEERMPGFPDCVLETFHPDDLNHFRKDIPGKKNKAAA